MAKNKPKIFLWTAIALVTSIIVGVCFLYYETWDGCGDQICELNELNICREDCKSECSYEYFDDLIKTGTSTEEKVKKILRAECSVGWEEEYTKSRMVAGISDTYVYRTKNYNYENLALKKIIEDYKKDPSKTTEQIVEEVGDYCYNNINYNSDLTYVDCITSQASDVNNKKEGVCSTMTKVDISILRGLGIATRPVVGCLSQNYQCSPLRYKEGITQSITGMFKRQPKTSSIEIDEEGYVISKGGIHTWLEVWLPDRGWTILEPTTGYLVEDCVSYKPLEKSPDGFLMCGLNNILYNDFIEECKNF